MFSINNTYVFSFTCQVALARRRRSDLLRSSNLADTGLLLPA